MIFFIREWFWHILVLELGWTFRILLWLLVKDLQGFHGVYTHIIRKWLNNFSFPLNTFFLFSWVLWILRIYCFLLVVRYVFLRLLCVNIFWSTFIGVKALRIFGSQTIEYLSIKVWVSFRKCHELLLYKLLVYVEGPGLIVCFLVLSHLVYFIIFWSVIIWIQQLLFRILYQELLMSWK